MRDRPGAQGAVAFAQDVLGAGPAVELARVAHDGASKGVGVLIHAPEGRTGRLGQRARIAGADHVDEDQVGLVQQGHVVGADVERRRALDHGAVCLHSHRAKGAHVQPHRRRARPAVIEVGHRTPPDRLTVQGIGDVEEAGRRHARVVANGQGAGRGLVAHGAAVGGDRMAGRHLLLFDAGASPVALHLLGVGVAQTVSGRANRPRATAGRFLSHGNHRRGQNRRRTDGSKQMTHCETPPHAPDDPAAGR
ncbi:hypothetical protein D3C86_1125370 [compost metagenome]